MRRLLYEWRWEIGLFFALIPAFALPHWAHNLQSDRYADHVLRRVESDPEFRARLRAALNGEKE